MAKDVALGSTVELDGDLVVVAKLGRVNDASLETREGFVKVDEGSKRAAKGMKRLKEAGQGVVTSFNIIKSAAGTMFKGLAIGAGIGAGLGVLGLKAWGDYELQIARIGTLLPRETNAMDRFGRSVAENSVRFGAAASTTADAFFQAISAGIPEQSVEKFFDVVGRASAGGFTEMNTAVDGLTNVLGAYGQGVEKAGEISDKIFVANRLGKTTFGELATQIGDVAPVAASMGIEIDNLLSGVVSMTTAGINTSKSITGIRAVLTSVIRQSPDAVKAAKDLGIEFNTAAINAMGFSGWIEHVREKSGGSADALAGVFREVEALGAMTRLTSETGFAKFIESMEGMKDAAGETEDAYDRVSRTLGFKMGQIEQGVSQWIRDIGQGLAEGLQLDKIEDIPSIVARVSEGVKSFSGGFAKALSETFAPMLGMAKTDWSGIGNQMGEMIGTMASEAASLATEVTNLGSSLGGAMALLEGFNGLLGGEGPAARAARRQGFTMVDGDQLRTNASKMLRGSVYADAADPNNGRNKIESMIGRPLTFAESIGISSEDATTELAAVLKRDMLAKIESNVGRINEKQAITLAKMADARAEQNHADMVKRKFIEDLQSAVGYVDHIKQTIGGMFTTVVNLNQDVAVNVNGEKKPGGGRKAQTTIERGGGDASLPSTHADLYLVFDGEVLAVSDDLTFRTAEAL